MNILSIIIPCKNEEDYIGLCLEAILKQENSHEIEIIVVDNGSEDKTLDIVKEYHDKVHLLNCPDQSVAGLRNFGASISKGIWLAFIDADIELAGDWYFMFKKWLLKNKKMGLSTENIVTGSTCSIPSNPHWMESIWFKQLTTRDLLNDRYINSGHMIVHKNLFEKIGGFNEQLTTGEDEKFCEDVRYEGGIILKEPSFKAVHHGYPKSIGSFFKREKWHGLGMKRHLKNPWKYRDLQLAIFFWLLFIMSLFLLVLGK
ncbi:MAG: glycosyltransferase, partial [Candidatus Thorarchaeota archaeon]